MCVYRYISERDHKSAYCKSKLLFSIEESMCVCMKLKCTAARSWNEKNEHKNRIAITAINAIWMHTHRHIRYWILLPYLASNSTLSTRTLSLPSLQAIWLSHSNMNICIYVCTHTHTLTHSHMSIVYAYIPSLHTIWILHSCVLLNAASVWIQHAVFYIKRWALQMQTNELNVCIWGDKGREREKGKLCIAVEWNRNERMYFFFFQYVHCMEGVSMHCFLWLIMINIRNSKKEHTHTSILDEMRNG